MTSANGGVPFPTPFMDWQLRERTILFDGLLNGDVPKFWAAHLPAVSTTNLPGARYPVHASTKGVGLIPRPAHIMEHVERIEACVERSHDLPPSETLADRVAAAREFYDRTEHIDDQRLGTIEIFGGQTWRNLKGDPRATLLFTSPGPKYISYQLNCRAEIVAEDDPVFRFILGMRYLFEMERFHIQQPRYTVGYVFTVEEAYDKAPKWGHAGKKVASSEGSDA